MNSEISERIVNEAYQKNLKRKPDEVGFKHFTSLLQQDQLTEEELIKIIRNSDEYARRKEADEQSKKNKTYIFKGFDDILYEIHSESSIDYQIAKNGIYDRYVGDKLKEHIKSDGTILDIGANVGGLSLPFAKKYVPLGKVYAFEPNMNVINQLKKNIEINGLKNIIIVPVALQENPSIQEINFNIRQQNEEGRINNGISTIQENPFFNLKKQNVKCTTVDKFVDDEKIQKIEFIKIDVEGSEYRVLEGASNTIQRDLPIVVYEFSNIIDNMINFPNSKKNKYGDGLTVLRAR